MRGLQHGTAAGGLTPINCASSVEVHPPYGMPEVHATVQEDGPVPSPDDYFDHDADIGIIGRGPTLERAFESAATATFALMADPQQVRGLGSVEVDFEEVDPELALVQWLNGLIGASRVQGLALGRFSLLRDGTHWIGRAWGDPWSSMHERGVEVKGATLTALSVSQDASGWQARCVVDV